MLDTPTAVPAVGFLRTSVFWILVRRALAMAVVGAVSAMLFVGVADGVTEWLWPDIGTGEAFSGSITTLLILSLAGLVVGVLHRLMPAGREVNVFKGMVDGHIDTKAVPGGLLMALVSLIGGGSLGPEVPTGMLSGGLATEVARRRSWDTESTQTGVRASITSAWSGLFTSPYLSPLMTLELTHTQSPVFWPVLMIQVAAALVGFGIFYVVGGWAEVLQLLDLPGYQLEAVDFFYGAAVGVVAAIGSACFVISMKQMHRLAAEFGPRPILKGTVAGIALGLLGMALPLTLFNGASGLVLVTATSGSLGITLILVTAVAKIIATTGALAFGFVGGPIFPAMYAGGSVGVALTIAFPGIPPVVAIAGGIAALPAGLVSVPFSAAVLGLLVAGAGAAAAGPVFTATVVSFVLVRGLGLTLGPPPDEELQIE